MRNKINTIVLGLLFICSVPVASHALSGGVLPEPSPTPGPCAVYGSDSQDCKDCYDKCLDDQEKCVENLTPCSCTVLPDRPGSRSSSFDCSGEMTALCFKDSDSCTNGCEETGN